MKPHGFLLLTILCSAPALAEVNTLEQALALAYSHDPGLQAERAKLRATDEQVSQALSNYRPSVHPSGAAVSSSLGNVAEL